MHLYPFVNDEVGLLFWNMTIINMKTYHRREIWVSLAVQRGLTTQGVIGSRPMLSTGLENQF